MIQKLENLNSDLMNGAKELKEKVLKNEIGNLKLSQSLYSAKKHNSLPIGVSLSPDTEIWKEKMDRDIFNLMKVKRNLSDPQLDEHILAKLVLWKRRCMRGKIKNVSISATSNSE